MKLFLFVLLASLSVGTSVSAVADEVDGSDIVILSVQKRDPNVKPVLQSIHVESGKVAQLSNLPKALPQVTQRNQALSPDAS